MLLLLLLLLFRSPLLLQHWSLFGGKFLFTLSLLLASLLLPVAHLHRFLNLLLLGLCLENFPLYLLLGVQLPKLRVNLLFHDLVFHVAPLLFKLLFALKCGPVVIKLGVFFAQSVILRFKLQVLSAGDLFCALCISFCLQFLKALEHLLTHLFGGLQMALELLFVDGIFGFEESGETSFALLQIWLLSAAHVCHTIIHKSLLNGFPRLLFPNSLVCQIFLLL